MLWFVKYYKKNIKDKAECQYKELIRNLKKGRLRRNLYLHKNVEKFT